MHTPDSLVAIFTDHDAVEAAVKRLNVAGFDITRLSVIGKGYHADEYVVGFYNQGDRMRLWGKRGAFWGSLWSLFSGGVFLTLPMIGTVIVLGYLATAVISVVEGTAVVGGVSAIAVVLYDLGIPRDRVIEYETAIDADAFLVLAHDTPSRIALAKSILHTGYATRIDVYADEPADAAIRQLP